MWIFRKFSKKTDAMIQNKELIALAFLSYFRMKVSLLPFDQKMSESILHSLNWDNFSVLVDQT